MTVEKFIRILGYIVYCILWSPVIAVLLLIMPIAWLIVFMRAGMTAKEAMTLYLDTLKLSIQHDMVFIQTGVWF